MILICITLLLVVQDSLLIPTELSAASRRKWRPSTHRIQIKALLQI